MQQDERHRSLARRAAGAVVAAVLVSACGTAGAADDRDDGRPVIAVTTTIMGDVVRNVAPADATVTVLMPPGSDPHTYEPSARQLVELQDADIVVASGGVEEGLRRALDETAAAGVPVFSALEHVTPLGDEDHDTDEDHEADAGGEDDHGDEDQDTGADDGHDHGGVDPHFWMDPLRMAEVVDALGARLGDLTGRPQATAGRARAYADDLARLDDRIAGLFADLPADRRTIVTNHEALTYFADRYDLQVVGTVIPSTSTGAEPSAQDIERLAAALRRAHVTTVFAESTAPRTLAEALAREVGPGTEVAVLHTESVGGDGDPATYIEMLETDAERIAQALRR